MKKLYDEETEEFNLNFDTVIGVVAAIIIGIILLIFSLVIVGENKKAVIVRFGEVSSIRDAGLSWKLPFIDKKLMVDTTTQGLEIGYRTVNKDNGGFLASMLNTDLKDGQEVIIPDEALMITKDFNFVNIDFYIEYRVSDPEKYLFASSNPIEILRNISQACIRTVVSNYNVDDVLTTGKNQIQADLKAMISEELLETDIGLQLENITIQDAEPPTSEIKAAFDLVETERQNKNTRINEANKYKNEQEPKAEANADEIIRNAEAKKTARINEAEGQVARFESTYQEFIKNPLITKQRMFYETMEEILPKVELIITDGTTETMLPLDSFASTNNVIQKVADTGDNGINENNEN